MSWVIILRTNQKEHRTVIQAHDQLWECGVDDIIVWNVFFLAAGVDHSTQLTPDIKERDS